ncbi:hypothetical protein C8F01DRAFT_1171224 [Mycena amicta]|nr:hypothetical protein C8F01DRAFT_1171224 [Mycena amicta]
MDSQRNRIVAGTQGLVLLCFGLWVVDVPFGIAIAFARLVHFEMLSCRLKNWECTREGFLIGMYTRSPRRSGPGSSGGREWADAGAGAAGLQPQACCRAPLPPCVSCPCPRSCSWSWLWAEARARRARLRARGYPGCSAHSLIVLLPCMLLGGVGGRLTRLALVWRWRDHCGSWLSCSTRVRLP